MYGVFTLCYALGAAYSVYSIKRQFNFANVSGMLGDLCPATVIQAYLPLSHKRSSSPSTTTAYRNSINLYLLHIPSEASFHTDDESNIKGNSFRGGGATWLSHIGVPVEQGKVIGYWFRDAVQRYIDPHFLNY